MSVGSQPSGLYRRIELRGSGTARVSRRQPTELGVRVSPSMSMLRSFGWGVGLIYLHFKVNQNGLSQALSQPASTACKFMLDIHCLFIHLRH
jgi:hypothetical protein